jgi:tRNA-dihydrouridine synthase
VSPSRPSVWPPATEHYDDLLSSYGVSAGLRHARKHLAGYAQAASRSGLNVPPVVRDELVRSDDPARVRALLQNVFAAPNMEKAA